ncbi:MAG: TIGR04211 family SH3 domain-containing protein [Woeseia sp.]|nr:TIGR04211 family SH3 domain-containing protein [Woeseia sp.]MBT8096738.1 TIGR04211 family SH3 domain-containing protein [Woeseia sp.]NNE60850.1 TIGR04211 family SH3 domain-containing protein [Woeseia sp.]NNL54492.1 TIGR04211 family SH3 domain-containing protein [Woeseia sp.]
MNKIMKLQTLPVFAMLILSSWVQAEPAWVSDQFEVMLRTGPSTTNAIQLMVDSGTRLEVIERDASSGYSRVRTPGGTEGWVLTRYLMREPAARQQLEQLTAQLTDAKASGGSLQEQLQAVRAQYQQATATINTLEREKQSLQTELDEIRRTAADVLAINNQNQRLQQQVTDAGIRIDTLEEENSNLSGQKNRNWFITGACVLFAGMLLGLWLPRMRWQRRSRYDSF